MQAIPSLLAERPNVFGRCSWVVRALGGGGYEEGGYRTEAFGPQAYSVMLPDEVEKACPCVF